MNPKIYINPEGVACYIADCPEEPKLCTQITGPCTSTWDRCGCEVYRRALAAAKQSAVPFIAGSLCKIGGLENAESGTFHPFPSGYKVEILHGQPCLRCNSDCYNHQIGDCKNQVAVLIPPSEKEESQEALWLEVQELFFDRAKVEEYMKRYTITRKSDNK